MKKHFKEYIPEKGIKIIDEGSDIVIYQDDDFILMSKDAFLDVAREIMANEGEKE